MKRIRKGSLNESIISALEKTAEGLVSFEDFVYHPYKYMGGHDIAPQRRPALLKSIQRLRMKGLVDKEIIEGKVILKLTSVGNDYLGIEREWDGKYRIVIWDIPENKRKIRDLFRRRLKEWKFINCREAYGFRRKMLRAN